jgi:hypothetical protein
MGIEHRTIDADALHRWSIVSLNQHRAARASPDGTGHELFE